MTYSGIKFDSKCRGKKEEIDKKENDLRDTCFHLPHLCKIPYTQLLDTVFWKELCK